MLKKLLIEKFHFPDEQIVTLSEAAGAEKRPTRANILDQFHLLAAEARPGDQILILLSGSGSRQPVQHPPDPADPEQNSLHSTFLPTDSGTWNTEDHIVARAIADDELCLWVKSIVDKEASVCLIIDTCHTDLGAIPEAEGFVAILATQPNEVTPEAIMPSGDPNGQYHGLFTWTLCEVLTQANTPLTYTQLVRRIRRRRYSARVQGSPTTPRVIGKRTSSPRPGRRAMVRPCSGSVGARRPGWLHAQRRLLARTDSRDGP